jgi:hypothetical protein
MSIICECGHRMEAHRYSGEGCDYCKCDLSPDTVEARTWARRMMKQKEEYKKAWSKMFWKYNDCLSERADLQAKLDEAESLWLEVCIERDTANDELRVIKSKLDDAIEAFESIIKQRYNWTTSEFRMGNMRHISRCT